MRLNRRHRSARAVVFVTCLFAVAVGAVETWAQSISATLSGTVRTSSGAPAAAAFVQARSDESGVVRATTADAKGRFRIDPLPPGTWTVVARSEEGVLSDSKTVTLKLQQTAVVDLTIGQGLVEDVAVSADAPLIDPGRTGGEVRLEASKIQSLPVAAEEVTDVALLDASVRTAPTGNYYGERGTAFVINGQSGRSNSFLVDGLDNNDQVSGTTLNAYFSPEAVSEVVVLTHAFLPEFGRATGAVFNMVTERGTNEFRTSFWTQGSARDWNSAGDLVSGLPNPNNEPTTLKRWRAGFNLGGPLVKDRAFFFANFERLDATSPTAYTGFDRYGSPGGLVSTRAYDDNLFLRTDANVDASNFLSVRLSADRRRTPNLLVGGIFTPEAGFGLRESDVQLAASLTTVMSGGRVNELRILGGISSFDQDANSSRPGVERPSGIFGGNDPNLQTRDENRFELVENFSWQAGPHSLKVGYDVVKSRTKVHVRFAPNGRFLYGTDAGFEPGDCGDILASQLVADPPRCSDDGTTQCATDADCNPGARCVFPDYPCAGTPGVDDDGDGSIDEPGRLDTYPMVFSLVEGEPRVALDDNRITLFAQDTWRVGGQWQFDYGLRYDVSTFKLPSDARVPSSIPNGGADLDWDNVAPRFGFTFTPTRDGKTVIRGGAGVFYDKLVLAFPALSAITSGTKIQLLFPQGLTLEINEDVVEQYGIDLIKQVLVFRPELTLRFSTGTRLDTPYTNSFNLGIDQGIGKGGMLSFNVVRNQGYRIPLMRDLNPVVDVTSELVPVHRDNATGSCVVPDPSGGTSGSTLPECTGSIAAIVTEGRSWYTGVEAGWRWQGRTGWHSISYTWSRSEDLSPDPLRGGIYLPPNSDDLQTERGRSDFDRRHRFVLAGETQLPWLGLRISGVYQWMSGAPFNITTGTDGNRDGFTTDRPEGVGRNSGATTSIETVNAYRILYGLEPVGSLDEPHYSQLDLRVSWPFPFASGRGKGNAYLQVYNVFNKYNPGMIEGRLLAQNFGRAVTQAGPPRTVEAGLKLGF